MTAEAVASVTTDGGGEHRNLAALQRIRDTNICGPKSLKSSEGDSGNDGERGDERR